MNALRKLQKKILPLNIVVMADSILEIRVITSNPDLNPVFLFQFTHPPGH